MSFKKKKEKKDIQTVEDRTIEVKKTGDEHSSLEKEVHRKIQKDLFKGMIQEFKIELGSIFEDNRINLKQVQAFNRFLTYLKKSNIMEITECLLFVEEDYTSFKKIKTVLNEENLEIVKHELAEKYRIPLKKNSLENFLYE